MAIVPLGVVVAFAIGSKPIQGSEGPHPTNAEGDGKVDRHNHQRLIPHETPPITVFFTWVPGTSGARMSNTAIIKPFE
jgi:hypothetical protein